MGQSEAFLVPERNGRPKGKSCTHTTVRMIPGFEEN
jgi:hypothetical protein